MKKQFLKTEEAISFTKQTFESQLSQKLELTKVSAPIAILQGTGINDDLNGVERVVEFPIKALNEQKAVIVNSLAKWKRIRLQELEVEEGKGIITDMRAIRPDEDYTPIHSVYVDQWDWEKKTSKEKRTLTNLKAEVKKIYEVLKNTEKAISEKYSDIKPILPNEITFISAEELLKQYPNLTPKERESKAAQQYGAIFIMGVGGNLSDGKPHDGRAPDYDDWSTKNEEGFNGLNGDIMLWHPGLKQAFEVSSMGIRVDKKALLTQLEERNANERKELNFHKLLLEEQIPQSIGGGIGQSRLCMFMLRKNHIGEVQVSIWSDDIRKKLESEGINLL